jgi:hypothetical protein
MCNINRLMWNQRPRSITACNCMFFLQHQIWIRIVQDVNTTMLGKLVWDMQQKSKKSWVHMFHDKYLNNMFFLSSVRSFGSPIWNSISKAKLALLKGFTYKVGDETFSFWFSFLLSNEQLYKKVELVVIQSTSTKWFLFQFLLTFKWSLHLCSKWYKDTQLESSLRVRIAIVWMWMSVVWVYRV